MRYDFVFKMNCVELYKNGQWSNTPEGMNQNTLSEKKELIRLRAETEYLKAENKSIKQ